MPIRSLLVIVLTACLITLCNSVLVMSSSYPKLRRLRGGGDIEQPQSETGPPEGVEKDGEGKVQTLEDAIMEALSKGPEESSETMGRRMLKEAEDWSVSLEESQEALICGQQHTLELRGGVDEMEGGKVAEYQYLVVGGGNAGGYVMKGLMQEGAPKGHTCLISAEASLPYERPALSKGYLLGKAPSPMDGGFNCVPVDDYRQHEVELRLRSRVTKIDLERKLVFMQSTRFGDAVQDIVAYRTLCIATGSRTLKLQCPGADLGNVFYVRDYVDVDKLKSEASAGRKAVVVGGGYIGLEVSACLAILGLDVTLVSRSGHLLPRLFTPEISRFFEDLWSRYGVKIIKNAEVTAIHGPRVASAVQLAAASSSGPSPQTDTLACDLVVAGVGSVPNTELFEGSKLELEERSRGVVVDARLRTSVPDVFAVGDCVSFPVQGLDGARRVEGHVTHARASALHAARSMLGTADGAPYHYLPLLYSRVDPWGLCWKFFGHNDGQCRLLGDVERGEFSAFWVRGCEIRGGLHCTMQGEQAAAVAFETVRSVVAAGEMEEKQRARFEECTAIEQVAEVFNTHVPQV